MYEQTQQQITSKVHEVCNNFSLLPASIFNNRGDMTLCFMQY